VTQLTAKVESDILVRDINGKTMASQPMVEKVNGRSLGPEGFAIEGTAVMVNDEAVAGFVIESLKTSNPVSVGRPLDEKTKVDGDSLTAPEGMTRICGSLGGFAELGLGADGACVQFSGNWNQRHAHCILVHIRDVAGVKMAKMLVP
jgi:hypothetical protein